VKKKRKIKAITAFKVIQDDRGRYQLKARIRFTIVINSNWHPISYRFGVIAAHCSNTLRFRATLWGFRDNVWCSSWAHCKARRGLPISVN